MLRSVPEGLVGGVWFGRCSRAVAGSTLTLQTDTYERNGTTFDASFVCAVGGRGSELALRSSAGC